jgi:hypothetical protein
MGLLSCSANTVDTPGGGNNSSSSSSVCSKTLVDFDSYSLGVLSSAGWWTSLGSDGAVCGFIITNTNTVINGSVKSLCVSGSILSNYFIGSCGESMEKLLTGGTNWAPMSLTNYSKIRFHLIGEDISNVKFSLILEDTQTNANTNGVHAVWDSHGYLNSGGTARWNWDSSTNTNTMNGWYEVNLIWNPWHTPAEPWNDYLVDRFNYDPNDGNTNTNLSFDWAHVKQLKMKLGATGSGTNYCEGKFYIDEISLIP